MYIYEFTIEIPRELGTWHILKNINISPKPTGREEASFLHTLHCKKKCECEYKLQNNAKGDEPDYENLN